MRQHPKVTGSDERLTPATAPADSFSSQHQAAEPHVVRYSDAHALARCVAAVTTYPAIVTIGATNRLTSEIARAQKGEAFVLHAGDCAESLAGAEPRSLASRVRALWHLGSVLEDVVGVPVVRIGRLAGQYTKPRSAEHEVVRGESIPVFRGENVNSPLPSAAAREPKAERMLWGHEAARRSVAVLDELLAAPAWARPSRSIIALARLHAPFQDIVDAIGRAFPPGAGASVGRDVFTSHEALLLPYEGAMIRRDGATDRAFNASAHFLWLGERTRDPAGAHVSHARAIANPVGVKIGAGATPGEVCALVRALNPLGVPGRLSLIPRLGAAAVRRVLPDWIDAVAGSGIPVLWSCDPMHGNTFKTRLGVKTRRLDDIAAEVAATLDVHRAAGSRLGGIHLEIAGEEVTECLGGLVGVSEANLGERYESLCDPRLSHSQSLELAWRMSAYEDYFATHFARAPATRVPPSISRRHLAPPSADPPASARPSEQWRTP